MPSRSSHNACLAAMYRLRRFGIKLGLAPIRRMLAGLGNPQRRLRCVHVAGTNGKGSVASALATILAQSGYRVGLYTSPHLVRFNERIRIDGREISDADIVRLYHTVRAAPFGSREPTFFEFTTAMALYEFSRRKVHWAVIETGMGGRLDATNVIMPELAVITNISLEHRDYLGRSIAEIAAEKAGIIKRRRPVVTAARQASARAVIRAAAAARSAPLYCLGADFRTRRQPGGRFAYHGIHHVWRGLATGLGGDYQVENAALALAACELLMAKAPQMTPESIRSGLAKNRWPGRLETVCEHPLVIFDGAHNLDASKHLARHLARFFHGRKITLVVGILNDKPYAAMLKHLAPLAHRIIVTRARTSRALAPETLAREAARWCPRIRIVPEVAAALRHALRRSGRDDVTLVAGSLYVVGEAKEALESKRVRLP